MKTSSLLSGCVLVQQFRDLFLIDNVGGIYFSSANLSAWLATPVTRNYSWDGRVVAQSEQVPVVVFNDFRFIVRISFKTKQAFHPSGGAANSYQTCLGSKKKTLKSGESQKLINADSSLTV